MFDNGACPRTLVVNLYDGARLASATDGTELIHWCSAGLYPVGRLTRACRAYVNVVELDVSTDVKIVGAWSLDGVSWSNFTSDISSLIQTTGLFKGDYRTEADFGPFVRYGVSVKENIPFARVAATLTLTVVLELSDET